MSNETAVDADIAAVRRCYASPMVEQTLDGCGEFTEGDFLDLAIAALDQANISGSVLRTILRSVGRL